MRTSRRQGVITVDDPNPSVGDTIIFTLTDPDGGIGGSVYSWNVQGREPEDAWQTLFRYDNIPATVEYTADEDHVGLEVRAVVASYQDRRGSGKSARERTDHGGNGGPHQPTHPPGSLALSPSLSRKAPPTGMLATLSMVSDRENGHPDIWSDRKSFPRILESTHPLGKYELPRRWTTKR